MGVRYISTDITQAFYIVQNHVLNVQNHVLNAASDGRLLKLASDSRTFFELESVPAGYAVHVPWWKFVVANPQPKLSVGLVTCNHAILEMDAISLKYSCRLVRDMLSGDGLRCFLFEGWGNPVRTPIWQAARSISKAGLCFAYNDGLFPILVRNDSAAASTAHHLPNSSAGGDEEAAWHPPIHIDPSSILAQKIKSGRDATARAGKHDVRYYDAMLAEVLGTGNLSTEDERCLSYSSEDLSLPSTGQAHLSENTSSTQPFMARLFKRGR